MTNIIHLLRKDFKRKWRNPVVIIGFMLIPLVFTLIFGMVFGSSDEQTLPKIAVLAADNDQSLLSGLFLGALTQGELSKLIELKNMEEKEGREQLDKGKASALLIIPKDFGKKVWDGQPAEILLIKNPSEQFLPQIVQEITDTASLLLSSLFSVFSDEVSTIRALAESEKLNNEEIASISVQIKDRLEGISKYVFPPVISLKEKTVTKDRERETERSLSVHGYILPAIALLFLLFVCNAVFEDILREKESGTLLRMTVSPLKLNEFIWSKIIISAVIGMMSTLVLVLLGKFLFSIHWGNFVTLLFIVICINILIAGFIAFLYSFIKTERQAGAVLSTVILIMSMLGGSMIPVQNFPPFMLNFSKLTINYWGIQAFLKNMLGDPQHEIVPILVVMLIAGLILASASTYFLNRSLRKGIS